MLPVEINAPTFINDIQELSILAVAFLTEPEVFTEVCLFFTTSRMTLRYTSLSISAFGRKHS